MSADRFRFQKIISLVLIILGLGFYSYKAGPNTEVTYQDCLAKPKMCRNQEIAVSYAPIISQDTEALILKGCRGPILVKGIGEEIKARYISVKGTFQNGAIVVTQIRTLPRRYLKYLLSVISLLFVGAAFFKEFEFNWQKLFFKKRRSKFKNSITSH